MCECVGWGVANVKRELRVVGSVPWFASGNAVLASLFFAAAPLVQVAGMLGYSNEDNPFGDTNLSQQFVWNKKLQKEQMETKSGGVLCVPVWPSCRRTTALTLPRALTPASCCPRSLCVSLPDKLMTLSKSDHRKKREEYLEELRKVSGATCVSVRVFLRQRVVTPPLVPCPALVCPAPLQVKERREQYEREREERDAKRIEDQRQREAELHGDWQEKEEEFHRIQS